MKITKWLAGLWLGLVAGALTGGLLYRMWVDPVFRCAFGASVAGAVFFLLTTVALYVFLETSRGV